MANTVVQSFAQLRSNLEITTLQSSTVSTRQQSVRKVIEGAMTVLDTFLTGSYSRSTMIAPLKDADIDIFVTLDVSYYYRYDQQNGGQAGLLDAVKRALRRTYTQTPDISRSGQAVTIRFNDFMVDVVPGFHRQGGGFLIPNSLTQTWLSTDPKRHVELMAASNKAHNNDLVPLIKMIKGWNRQNGAFFRSFHLEVLALQILQGVTISDFPSGARFYFDKARSKIKEKNLDPAGYGDDVGRYLNTSEKVGEAVRRLETAYNRAIKAEDYARRGYVNHAIDEWRKIFGDYFPAYG